MSIDTSKMIFVFGSNTGGIHGAGAARFAREQCGAVSGIGVGLMGRSYALPTKGVMRIPRIGYVVGNTLSLNEIKTHVDQFIDCAERYPALQFQVTAIGCGLAGLRHQDIAPMFRQHSPNCYFDLLWADYLPAGTRFWGTF